MNDWNFRFGPIWGCLTVRPETNCVGLFVDRRGWNFSLNIGLFLFSALVCIDFESHASGEIRRIKKAEKKAAGGQ